MVFFTNRSRTGQAKKQQPKTTTKDTTIMMSRPTILHRRLYFSAYTPLPLPLAVDGMTDSPDIVSVLVLVGNVLQEHVQKSSNSKSTACWTRPGHGLDTSWTLHIKSELLI